MHAAVLVALIASAPLPTDYALAESLIRDPDAAVDTGFPFRERVAARVVAERLELAGPGVWFDWNGGGVGVYHALNQYLRRLATCPPLADVMRLPPVGDCQTARNFNTAYARAIRDRIPWERDREERLSAAAAEVDLYAEFWGAAATAREETTCIDSRRAALRTCRELVGAEAWQRGEIPDWTTGRFAVPR